MTVHVPEGSGPLPEPRPAFTEAEVACLHDGSAFRVRARMMEKIRQIFEGVRDRLLVQLASGNYLRPDGADLGQGRVGRGENLDDMPYVYLDLPFYIGRESLFTFRSLFWWSHGVSFSLILAGEHLPEYRQRLLGNLEVLEALDVHIATPDTPWDWERGPGHTLPLAAGEEGTLLRLFRTQGFLKCSRFLQFNEAEFRENRIDEAALLTFRALEPLILA